MVFPCSSSRLGYELLPNYSELHVPGLRLEVVDVILIELVFFKQKLPVVQRVIGTLTGRLLQVKPVQDGRVVRILSEIGLVGGVVEERAFLEIVLLEEPHTVRVAQRNIRVREIYKVDVFVLVGYYVVLD